MDAYLTNLAVLSVSYCECIQCEQGTVLPERVANTPTSRNTSTPPTRAIVCLSSLMVCYHDPLRRWRVPRYRWSLMTAGHAGTAKYYVLIDCINGKLAEWKSIFFFWGGGELGQSICCDNCLVLCYYLTTGKVGITAYNRLQGRI